MALAFGQRDAAGLSQAVRPLLTKLKTELPEVATPQVPSAGRRAAQMTVAFGHGIADHADAGGDGRLALRERRLPVPRRPSSRARSEAGAGDGDADGPPRKPATRCAGCSATIRSSGSDRHADVPGYVVGGKTGTAEKIAGGRYVERHYLELVPRHLLPWTIREYALLVSVDDPKREKPGLPALAAWNAAYVAGNVIRRSAAFLGVQPRTERGRPPRCHAAYPY